MVKHGNDKPQGHKESGPEATGDNLSAEVQRDREAQARKLEGKAKPGSNIPETAEGKWADSLVHPEKYLKTLEELVKNHSAKQLQQMLKDSDDIIAAAQKRIPELPKLLAAAEASLEKDLKH